MKCGGVCVKLWCSWCAHAVDLCNRCDGFFCVGMSVKKKHKEIEKDASWGWCPDD